MTCPSPSPRVAAPTTPLYLGEAGPGREGRGRGRRGRAGGSQSAGRCKGRGWGHRLRPKHPNPGALWSRAAPRPSGARAGEPPPLLGTPTFGAQNLPPRPSFAGVSAATVAGKRAPPLPPLLHPPLTRHPFFLFLR